MTGRQASRGVIVLLLLHVILGCSHPPRDNAGTAAFASAARAATSRYASQEVAIADGFRRVGGDFPAMGEHWVNLAQVMADTFAATKPSVLTYIRVDGKPQLAGVGYTKLLATGQSLPDFAPARGYWHEHNGSIVEESFRGHDESPSVEGAPHLAILHAWIWMPNPDGLFVTDNWTLPFARLGLSSPNEPDGDASRAAALLTNADYYREALSAELAPTSEERERLDSVIDRFARQADTAIRPAVRRGQLTDNERDALARLWPAFWASLSSAAPTRVAALHGVEHRLMGM